MPYHYYPLLSTKDSTRHAALIMQHTPLDMLSSSASPSSVFFGGSDFTAVDIDQAAYE
jgi:hypothetical protein